MTSPYIGIHSDKWAEKTDELIASYPLRMGELVDVVLSSWEGVLLLGLELKISKLERIFSPSRKLWLFSFMN